ncbi:hypothetical protein CFC21_111575 [Triticum aestivum]|uniref:F-box/LRR-repeat protein 15/At3g58940/PEG3-like LRR domain-containing protein n=4 Tax=Triticinae TaxID=1648030 RepID=A0A453T6Z5_AEGTS|nr:MEIOTIC F-BOX protein MOF-like [Aegilops tauschii subsp. strangulata]XP_044443907.1 MEIOTIC F-BOX protein MOF-like [Triticum aestivum]KAF7111585.1 hypothetical protein CFC21_111575 [Triticum aestivum]
MEASSGPSRSSSQEPDGPCDGADRLSALPDDLLLDVLARLPCAAAAARTEVLSRRWLGLWAGLRQIVFRGVALPSLEAALGRVDLPLPAVSLIKIRVPIKQQRPHQPAPKDKEHWRDSAGVPINSLLRAAARLEPEKLDFRIPSGISERALAVDLPCLPRATFIALNFSSLFSLAAVPAGAEFPALETLSLAECITDLGGLLSCCPRLRTLRLSRAVFPDCVIRVVNSPLLQELVVECEARLTQRVVIVAPELKQLTISFTSVVAVNITVLAPVVEKISWQCCYLGPYIVFGLWSLSKLRLQSAERQGEPTTLYIYACVDPSPFRAQVHNFRREIQRHMVAAFSVFELHLTAKGHAFGAFVVHHLLGMDRISTATRRLKVVLHRSELREVCPTHCPCESPNWRSQTISLDALEEVEFNGFDGVDHEFDLLELILGCAPMLKRMIVKLSEETSASNDGCAKIVNIFKQASSSVECNVYHSSGIMYSSQNCPST